MCSAQCGFFFFLLPWFCAFPVCCTGIVWMILRWFQLLLLLLVSLLVSHYTCAEFLLQGLHILEYFIITIIIFVILNLFPEWLKWSAETRWRQIVVSKQERFALHLFRSSPITLPRIQDNCCNSALILCVSTKCQLCKSWRPGKCEMLYTSTLSWKGWIRYVTSSSRGKIVFTAFLPNEMWW